MMRPSGDGCSISYERLYALVYCRRGSNRSIWTPLIAAWICMSYEYISKLEYIRMYVYVVLNLANGNNTLEINLVSNSI